MKKIILLMLFVGSCSTLDQKRFLTRAIGRYTLNEDGLLFINKELDHYALPQGTEIEFSETGDLLVINGDESIHFATFLELKKENEGIFRIVNKDTFVAMGYLSSSPEPLWISSTNTFLTEDSVLLEHVLPIATKIPDSN